MAALRYKDKVTIVTGGARGIGQGIAQVFVQEGATVVFCSNNEAEGKETEAALNIQGPGRAVFVLCELTNEQDIKRLIEVTAATHGHIDCLVNNAGEHPPLLPIDDVSGDDLRHLMDVNLVAYFLTCKYALPHLRRTKGNIINIGSLVTLIGEKNSAIYAATKCIAGNIWTPMWEQVASVSPDPKAMRQEAAEQQLVGRCGTPHEIGKACLYLAADASFSTGTDTVVSGGAELDFGYKSMVAKQ